MENANGVIKKLTSAERSYYTAAEVREKQDVYNSASYGQMIRKEFYVEVVDRPLSRTKDLTLLLEYDRVCREILERCG